MKDAILVKLFFPEDSNVHFSQGTIRLDIFFHIYLWKYIPDYQVLFTQ